MKITLLKYGLLLGVIAFLLQKITEVLSLEVFFSTMLASTLFLLIGFLVGKGFNSSINGQYRGKQYFAKLTPREKEVAELILKGYSNKEICDAICVEASTVKTHINKIYQKCEASSRAEFREKLIVALQ